MLKSLRILGLSLPLFLTHGFTGENFKLEPLHATASWEVGEIENFDNASNQTLAAIRNKQLISHSAVWLLQEARLADNMRAFVGVGGMYFFIPAAPNNLYSFGQRSAFGLTDAHGEFEFGNRGGGDHNLLLKAGVFPFKYNEDAKNLGEYMFRTYTYPTVIYTGGLVLLNSAGAQLNGLDANTRMFGVNNDLLLTIKTDQVPSGSLSLTDMASYSFQNFFTIGAGVMFDNIYDPTNLARGNYDPKASRYYVLKNGRTVYDSAGMTDSIKSIGHYTFKGEKVMARASLDLGNIITHFAPNPFLGNGQLRIYSEVIIMGLKNYPGYYDTLKNRTAYMVGANLPTLGLLDFLSLEMEYCSNPYRDNANQVVQNLNPIPKADLGGGTADDVKWTVYARKNVYKGFSITAQAARDHLRLTDFYGHYYDESVMTHPRNWYWALQLAYAL